MSADPLIREIHQVRQAYAERFGNDLRAISDAARAKQGVDGRPVLHLTPKPAMPVRNTVPRVETSGEREG